MLDKRLFCTFRSVRNTFYSAIQLTISRLDESQLINYENIVRNIFKVNNKEFWEISQLVLAFLLLLTYNK